MGNCKTKKCGCLDTGLTTPSPCSCDKFLCPNPEPCPETFGDCCIIHTGPSIEELGISTGESLCKILEIMALMATSPQCVGADKACQSPQSLNIILISPTTIKIGWVGMGTPVQFVVQYKEVSALAWFSNVPVASNLSQDTIGGLLPNTEYLIKVQAYCDQNLTTSCASITTKVKTKSN